LGDLAVSRKELRDHRSAGSTAYAREQTPQTETNSQSCPWKEIDERTTAQPVCYEFLWHTVNICACRGAYRTAIHSAG